MPLRSGGGMSVLIHRNVAMEGFVGKGRAAFEELVEEKNRSESSSIGADEDEESSVSLSSSSVGDHEDEVQSELREDEEEEDTLPSLGALEDSLPIKRGLSNFFNGKAKSFSSLADVVTAPTTAADLAKQEHPFNKRRRVLMAAKKRAAWPRRASCSSLNTLPHPSLLASELLVLEEDEEEEDSGCRGDSPRLPPLPTFHGRGLKSFRSPRSFSLTDLQQHDEFS